MYVIALGLYPRAALVVDVGVAHGAMGEFQGAAHEDSVCMDGKGGHHMTRRNQLTSLPCPPQPFAEQADAARRKAEALRAMQQASKREAADARKAALAAFRDDRCVGLCAKRTGGDAATHPFVVLSPILQAGSS